LERKRQESLVPGKSAGERREPLPSYPKYPPDLAKNVLSQYLQPDGRLRWPEDRGERTEVARVLFGRGLAETYDVSLTDALDYLHNSAPHTPFERKNEAYEADTWLRTRLNTLSADQRHAVEVLLTDSLYGMIFSLLVSVDQPHE